MKLLKFTVVLMGVLIALGLGLLVYGFTKQSSDPDWRLFGPDKGAPPPWVAETEAPLIGDVSLGLPEGHLIKRVFGGRGRIFVLTGPKGSGPNRVHVIDGRTGKVIGSINP